MDYVQGFYRISFYKFSSLLVSIENNNEAYEVLHNLFLLAFIV